MFARLKLSTQLSISFVSILMFVLIVSIVAYVGLTKGHKSLQDYTQLSNATKFAAKLQENLLSVRINALEYISDNDPQTLALYQQRIDDLHLLFDEAEKSFANTPQLNDFRELKTYISAYESGFIKVVELITQGNKTISEDLNPNGLAMRTVMSQVIEYSTTLNQPPIIFHAAKAQESLLLGRLYATKYLITNINADYQRAKKELEVDLKASQQALNIALSSTQGTQLMAKVNTHYQQYINALDKANNIIIQRNIIINDVLNVNGKLVSDKLGGLTVDINTQLVTLGKQANNTSGNTILLVEIVTGLSIVVGLLVIYFLPKIIRQPIGGEPMEIERIVATVAKGDLTQNFKNRDNASGIYKSVISMNEAIKHLIKGISISTLSLSDTASNSAKVAQDTNHAIRLQRDRTATVVTAVEEMTYSIQQVVELSTDSAQAGNEAQTHVKQGKNSVDNTLQSIQGLADRVSNSIEVIRSLEEHSQKIGSVIEVIKNISEQTNLLALNAAIEAARAGEQGRGFAVVADEVRGLAQRTQASTTEINDMITALQTGAHTAVSVMEESGVQAQETVSESIETGKVLDAILESIDSISNTNAKVAAAIQEQATVTKDINVNISAISDATEESGIEAEKSAQASKELLVLADDIQSLLATFKTN